MWDKAIEAMILSLILTVVPAIYNVCKKNKQEKEAEGKIYYGFFRISLLYIVSLISSELLLVLILGAESVDGREALTLTLICSVPFMYIYLLIYKNYQMKKLNKNQTQGNKTEYNEEPIKLVDAKRYCINCGHQSEEMNKYCTNCGHQLKENSN